MSSLTGVAAVLATPSPALAANAAYVFGYFKETPNQSGDSYALHLAVSTDGLNWRPLNQNNPVATPTAGTLGLRDPFIPVLQEPGQRPAVRGQVVHRRGEQLDDVHRWAPARQRDRGCAFPM